MYNVFATDPKWWGSPDRGSVPLGWTLSPALHKLGPVILDFLAETKTLNDDIIGAPSGVGYIYPSTWAPDRLRDFAALTGQYLEATSDAFGAPISAINVIGDPCEGGGYKQGCKGLMKPNKTSLAPILAQQAVDGIFWYVTWQYVRRFKAVALDKHIRCRYTFGAGYSGWHDIEWDDTTAKPIVGGRLSLWGESIAGTMLGVRPLVEQLKLQLFTGKISTKTDRSDGYSLIPVHAWSHNVSDVRAVAEALTESGHFEIVTPTQLLSMIRTNVNPPLFSET